jgi:hypothetical protein
VRGGLLRGVSWSDEPVRDDVTAVVFIVPVCPGPNFRTNIRGVVAVTKLHFHGGVRGNRAVTTGPLDPVCADVVFPVMLTTLVLAKF